MRIIAGVKIIGLSGSVDMNQCGFQDGHDFCHQCGEHFVCELTPVPLSARSWLDGRWTMRKCRKAFMKLVDMESNTSMCVALVLMHMNSTAHRLLSALLPQGVTMFHSLKTSNPTWVKGGSVVSLSTGGYAIFWSINLPFNFLEVTQS